MIDPKSELSPPVPGAHPARLRQERVVPGPRPPRVRDEPAAAHRRPAAADRGGAIAENIVAALLDINENQIFQSSRRYLYHAVDRRDRARRTAAAPRQVRGRLHASCCPPRRTSARPSPRRAPTSPTSTRPPSSSAPSSPTNCGWPPAAPPRSASTRRATRSAGLLRVPPLRRFFNHPTDIPLREIIEARDVLIVDANMGAIGEENSKACMQFLLRMLHTQMQRQVHLPETDRPRVPLLIDEAHYVAGAENVVDQIATHRRAGLEPAFGLQYFAQLGSGSQHEQKIRKGVLNLLQSRFLFRMGDAEDAEEATRIAMAVYSTHDPRRPRLPRPPARHPRAGAQLPQPPLPRLLDRRRHPRSPASSAKPTPVPIAPRRVGRAPPRRRRPARRPLPRTAESSTSTRCAPTPSGPDAPPRRHPQDERRRRSRQRPPKTPGREAPQPDRRSPRPASTRRSAGSTAPTTSPATSARCASTTSRPGAAQACRQPRATRRRTPRYPGPSRATRRGPAPDSLRELAFLDRINEIGPADQLDGAARLPRLYDEDYAILALLDRAGLAPALADRPRGAPRPRATHRRAPADQALPPRADRPAHHRPARAHPQRRQAAAAVLAHPPRPRGRPDPPAARDLPQARVAADRTAPRRRASRTTCTPSRWAIELHRIVGDARHRPLAHPALRHRPLPRPPNRHPAATATRSPSTRSRVPDGQAIIDVAAQDVHRDQARPLARAADRTIKLTFDLLVELDLTARPSYNHDKLLAYDAFLCGWSLAHPRYRAQGTRPAVIFVCPDAHAALALAREADEAMTGRIGAMGTPPSTGTTPAATTCSSPSKPTSTTATSPRSRSRRQPPGCASGSPANAIWN